MTGKHGAETADHVGGGEEAAVLGNEEEKIPGQPLDLHLLEDGGERSRLLLGGEDRALDQPRKVVDGIERGGEAVKIGGDFVEGVCFTGKLEERGGIAPGNARNSLLLDRQCLFLPNGRPRGCLVPGPRK